MRNLTKIELDTLRWVRDDNGSVVTARRRKTFQNLVALTLVTEKEMATWKRKATYHYQLTSNGQMMLSSYDGPRRVVSVG